MCALHVQKVFWVVARVVTRQVHPQVSIIFWSLDMIWVNLWDFFFTVLLFTRQKSKFYCLGKYWHTFPQRNALFEVSIMSAAHTVWD